MLLWGGFFLFRSCCFFPPLDFFRVQSLPQDFIKLSGTPVPAHRWTVHHWSWWVCNPWNLALRGTPLGVKLALQPKSFNLLVRWAVSPWTLYTASCKVDLCWTSSHFRPSSGNLIVKLRIYGSYLQLETVSVPFKKQTFAMSYYIELWCSSFFSTVKCDFSNSVMWKLLTNAERWFFDYRNHSPLTHTFPLGVQIHPLLCLVLLIPSYPQLELIACLYLS